MEQKNRGDISRENRRDYGSNENTYSSEGRRLRPRRNSSERTESGNSEYGERRPFRGRRNFSSEGRSFGESRGFRNRESNGERRNSSEGRRPSFGDRPNFGDRKQSGRDFGERRNFGERRSFGENRGFRNREDNGERRNFAEGRRLSFGDRRNSFGDDRRERRDNRYSSFDRRGGFSSNRERLPFKRQEFGFNESSEAGINKMLNKKTNVDFSNLSDKDTVMGEFREEVRLNKFIANSGICSRREADIQILAGVVTVNGEVVTELGTKVNIIKDIVKFDGQVIKGEEKVYIVMNKPKGFVTTASDPHAERTVMDLLRGCKTRVFSVGRLDKNTTGVLMFTNDGELAEKLTHPSYDKKKIYQVVLDHELTEEDHDKIIKGIELNDGFINADELEYIDEEDHRKLGIKIHSGKNRIVRRIFESLGYDVKALDRVYFAGLTKKGLQKGEWRYLSENEINVLKMGAYI